MYKELLIAKLTTCNIIQHGSFKLKSGKETQIYFNLKNIVSYPSIYRLLLHLIKPYLSDAKNALLCGVPMGAIPLASVLSHECGIPMIMLRSNAKDYGMKKQIEGEYQIGQKVILIEDVITTGGSIYEAIKIIEANGLKVEKVICILDRDEEKILELSRYNIVSLLQMNDVLNYKQMNVIYRRAYKKNSNIIFSCDLTDKSEIIRMIERIGNKIIGVKLHADIINGFDEDFVNMLNELKHKYELILIEDRKYSDIGATIMKQLSSQNIGMWADYITMQPIAANPQLISDIKQQFMIGVIVIAEMSIDSEIMTDDYIKNALKIADNITGIVCQKRALLLMGDDRYKYPTFSPGISITEEGDNYNQKYTNIVDMKDKTLGNIWIVGRGIYQSENIEASAETYRKHGWNYFVNY